MSSTVYRRELARYHKALARYLRTLQDINKGGARHKGEVRKEEQIIQQFHLKKRKQRLEKQRFRSKGPLIEREEWERGRAVGKEVRNFTGLRLEEEEEVKHSNKDMLSLMQKYYGDIFADKNIAPTAASDFPRGREGLE